MISPKKIVLTSGVGYGATELTAFDAALLNAGIGNYNLIKVSSIIPPSVDVIKFNKKLLNNITVGSIIPVVYNCAFSNSSDMNVITGIACGLSNSKLDNGVIFEVSGSYNKLKAKSLLDSMIDEASSNRNCKYEKRKYIFAQACYTKKSACAVVAALLLY